MISSPSKFKKISENQKLNNNKKLMIYMVLKVLEVMFLNVFLVFKIFFGYNFVIFSLYFILIKLQFLICL